MNTVFGPIKNGLKVILILVGSSRKATKVLPLPRAPYAPNIPPAKTHLPIDIENPTRKEFSKAFGKLKNGKSIGLRQHSRRTIESRSGHIH